MSLALCALSHSPLRGLHDPADEVMKRVDSALERIRTRVRDASPKRVVLLAPDHFNGHFYTPMPQFCLGLGATAVGDYGTPAGPVRVTADEVRSVHEALLEHVDVAVAYDMVVDHAFAQPLEILFGGLDAVPVIPLFVNCAAAPLSPVSRSLVLGETLGRILQELEGHTLVLASGGLSHDPPLPSVDHPEHRERLVSGRQWTAEERVVREARTVSTAQGHAAGSSDRLPLAPDWDAGLLRMLADGCFEQLACWDNDSISREAGGGGHEIRTWVAGFRALCEAGPYAVRESFYEPIPEWMVGFGAVYAEPAR